MYHWLPVAEEEVSVTDPPEQKVVALPAEMVGVVGIGLTVMSLILEVEQPVAVTVSTTVRVPLVALPEKSTETWLPVVALSVAPVPL